jgi:hypothetical protein
MMTMESERSEQSRRNERRETIQDLLDAYEHSSRVWLARLKSEVDLWSELAAKLSATRSMPEALDSYQRFVMQRMEMAAQDGRQLAEDSQDIARKMTRSLSAGWPTASS